MARNVDQQGRRGLRILICLFILLPSFAWANCIAIVAEPVTQTADAKQEWRDKFADQWLYIEITDEEQNQKWIDNEFKLAKKAELHALWENALMKRKNTEWDKDFVTAVTNFNKFVFHEEIHKVLPELKFDLYSDFKSVRLAIRSPVNHAILANLDIAFANANRRFYQDELLRQIMRASDFDESWFQMGLGYTADQASLAARFARDVPGPARIARYWDHEVQKALKQKLAEFQTLHRDLMTLLKGTKLLEVDQLLTTLQLEVFTAARKAKSVDGLRDALREYFPTAILSEDIALKINRYVRLSDDFSPSMLIAKRESIAIHNAPFGALSLDFIGLGAENLKATAKALALATDLDHAILLSRQFEREVTANFSSRKAAVRTVVLEYLGDVEISFSGDDGVIILNRFLTVDELLELMNRLTALSKKPYFRMVTVDAESAGKHVGVLITHAENIEKKIRELLLRKGAIQLSEKITMQVLISENQAFLLLSASVPLVEPEKNIMKRMFPRAVNKIVHDIQQQGGKANYETMDLFGFPEGAVKPKRVSF